MAISKQKAALDNIAQAISTEEQAIENAIQRIRDAVSNLNSLPTIHSEAIAEINALTGTDASVLVSKDELSKLTTEFTALVSKTNTIIAAIEAV